MVSSIVLGATASGFLSPRLCTRTEQVRATRSAACLREFMADDVLLQDSQRSMTVVHQEFSAGGRTLVRKGFIARVRL